MMRLPPPLLLLLLLLVADGAVVYGHPYDCPQLEQTFVGYGPRNGTTAGQFRDRPAAHTLPECVYTCCDDPSCNVIVFADDKCYHGTCITNDACVPVRSIRSTMVLVRAVGADSWRNVLNALQLPSTLDAADDDDPAGARAAALQACVVGVPDCGENEQCVQNAVKSRAGTCRCVEHYERDADGVCTPLDDAAMPPPPPPLLAVEGGGDIALVASTETPPQARRSLSVLVDNEAVQLPRNEVKLHAIVTPPPLAESEKYNFEWTLLRQPDGSGALKKQDGDDLQLTQLSEGVYTFKLNVSSEFSYGETHVNVTVLPPSRINQPPRIVITPANRTITLPNHEAVLDATASTDDDKIVSYHWELQQGPVGYQPHLAEVPMLELKDLDKPGNYTFKLTVTDTDKATSSATANITVLPTIDYPPNANAGPDAIVYLPHNQITLNATMSSDDHNITAWEWTKVDTSLAVDMQDTRTPYLKLSNLEEGIYAFQLKVTDVIGQSSTSKVRVYVRPPTNQPPVAVAGANVTISLPQTWALVTANQSSDDSAIVAFKWTQVAGPSAVVFVPANASTANATALTKGAYTFRVTVTDDSGNTASALQYVLVEQNKNQAPRAVAGGDFVVTLPRTAIYLNGTRSSDDWAIVRWEWQRAAASLAYGKLAEGSERTPVLILTDVVPGVYVFELTVYDEQGLSDTDAVTVTVHADPMLYYLVDMIINADVKKLTHVQCETMKEKLGLLIEDETRLQVRELSADTGTERVVIRFFIEQPNGAPTEANRVVRHFREKLKVDADILGFSIAGLQSVVCQNNCSGHGMCDERTRACRCDTFWMRDLLAAYWSPDGDADCAWSILYVVLGVLCALLATVIAVWAAVYACVHRCASPATPSTTYKLIENADERDHRAGCGGGLASNKVGISDTDSDSDVVFESRNKPTSMLRNGGGGHKTLTTTRNGFAKMGRRIKT